MIRPWTTASFAKPVSPGTACDFWLDGLRVAQAVREALAARKINYEIHGNTISHLHMHLYPRYDGDPFDGAPIDGSATTFQRSAEDLDRLPAAVKP